MSLTFTQEFAERIEAHQDEARVIREGLAHEGPKLVRYLCEHKGFSLRGLSKRAGLSPTYMSNIENQRCICSPDAFITLARIDKECPVVNWAGGAL